MRRNAIRVEVARKALKKHQGVFDLEQALKDDDFLELALGIVFTKYSYLSVDDVHIIYGMPILCLQNSLILVLPYIDNCLYSTLSMDGKYVRYSEEEIIDRFKHISSVSGLKPGLITVKLFSSIGLIHKETDADFERGTFAHLKNKVLNIKLCFEEL